MSTKTPFLFGAISFLLSFFALNVTHPQAQTLSRSESLINERQEKAKDLHPYKPNKIENTLLFVQEERVLEKFAAGFKGFHPVLGGMSTGSGFAMGVLFAPLPEQGDVHFSVSAAASFKGYQSYNAAFGTERGPVLAYSFLRHRNFPQEDYFGLGPGSSEEERTSFRLEDAIAGGLLGVRPHRSVLLGGYYARLRNNVGAGTDPRFPSAEALFAEADTPGLETQSDFDVVGFKAELETRNVFFSKDYGSRYAPTANTLRNRVANPNRGTYASFTAARYRDRDEGNFDFNRYEAELQHYIPISHGHRVIALRHFTTLSQAAEGGEVPFYLMRTLGGSNILRGFREFRFRDRHAMFFNLEYRWQAWIGLDMALFYDAGKVFSTTKDLNFKELERSYGIGFRFNTFRSVLLRIDIGHSREGTRYFFGFGHVF